MQEIISRIKIGILGVAVLAIFSPLSHAEVHWQELQVESVYGTQYSAYSASTDSQTGFMTEGTTEIKTLTLDYTNAWDLGVTYFYVDLYMDGDDINVWTQGYEHFSLSKILKTDAFTFGPVADLNLSLGWQLANNDPAYAGDTAQAILDSSAWPGMKPVNPKYDVIDIFTGADFKINAPGFDAMGLTIGVYTDLNDQTDYDPQLTAIWYYRSTFSIGPTDWKAEGFVQWYDKRDSNSGALNQQSWLFSNLQFMLDTGKLLWGTPNQLYLGTEVQWSIHKFGLGDVHNGTGYITRETNELFPALILEWVF